MLAATASTVPPSFRWGGGQGLKVYLRGALEEAIQPADVWRKLSLAVATKTSRLGCQARHSTVM